MADISQEIAAFQNAVYGEEVRSSMVSAIEKINDVCEDAESTVESFSSGVTQAISNANTAASAANTAASNANTKASAANTAATNANTARTAANNAATAANNAASAATTTNTNITNAESARVSAENARATAEATRQANEQSRQTAETARVNAESARASAESSRASAESQRQSNESTRQGNETVRQTQEGLRVSAESSRVSEFEDMQAAFADMQRQVVPKATTSTMGGVIVGDGLNVDNALLSLATTKSGSGTAVASNGAVLESVVVYGQSDQEGTPTPSEPVDVQVVEGRNLLKYPFERFGWASERGVTYTPNNDGSVTASGTASGLAYLVLCNGGNNVLGLKAGDVITISTDSENVFPLTISGGTGTINPRTITIPDGSWTVGVGVPSGNTVNETFHVQIERGSTATPYVPYGSIGIVIGDTATPIDLQGNVLASLPDGTRDTVTVDGAGHVVLEKRVAQTVLDGTENWLTTAQASNGVFALSFNSQGSKVAELEHGWNANNGKLISDHFVQDQQALTSMGDGGMKLSDSFYVKVSGITTVADIQTWLASNNTIAYSPYATAKTIDLGYIDMPTIPEGATISVSASITPVIDASWWERGAEALASIVKAFSERIKALEEAVAELATA